MSRVLQLVLRLRNYENVNSHLIRWLDNPMARLEDYIYIKRPEDRFDLTRSSAYYSEQYVLVLPISKKTNKKSSTDGAFWPLQ